MQTEIYLEFEKWLDNLLENNDIPDETAAFNFNLYEESAENSIYSIQIIAADNFDENDSDWACCEVWSSEEDIFCIELSDENDSSRNAAEKLITEMCEEYLESGKYREILLGTKAVGLGFVDGDLDIIYRAERK